MNANNVAFISSRRRGITPDMKLINEYLLNSENEFTFQYHISNERVNDQMKRQGVAFSKNEFCKKIDNVVCIDASLTEELGIKDESNRILFAIPYDYQFKQSLETQVNAKNLIFRGFSHIYANSRFTYNLLKEKYDLSNSIMIDGLCSPMAWSINQAEHESKMKELFIKMYPACRDKKICAIIISKQLKEEEEKIEFAIKDFISKLGEEWFVFTNSDAILEEAATLSARYVNNFGYIKNSIPLTDLLYFSDMLISNNSYYATTYASKKKPFYCISYNDNYFETFMKKYYPQLFITNFNGLLENSITEAVFLNEHARFCDEFSYEIKENPCTSVEKLLFSNNSPK